MSFIFQALRILSLFAFLAAIPAESRSYDAPYGSQGLIRLPNGRIGLMVRVNGQGPFLFCLDTGTSKTVLTPALQQKLGLPAAPGGPVPVVTAAGRSLSQFYPVAEVAAVNVTVEGERAVVVDLPGRLGVLGALGGDFLSNFVVDLDLRHQIVKLYPLGASPGLTGLGRTQGRFDQHGMIIVPALVNGIAVDAIIDTGAEATVVNLGLATALNHEAVVAFEPAPISIHDAERRRLPAPTIGFKKIRLGPASWMGGQVLVSDLPIFDELGLNRRPAILLGMDVLAARRMVLDFGSAALWLEP